MNMSHRSLLPLMLALTASAIVTSYSSAGNTEDSLSPVTVIFDTDLGNDIDDLLAYQMLINYEKCGKIKLAGTAVSKDNPLALEAACRYYGCFGSGNPRFGTVIDGPNRDAGNYLLPVIEALNYTAVSYSAHVGCAHSKGYEMMRRILSESPDSSVVIITTGPMVNLEALLRSVPDSVSDLDGIGLVSRKVRMLSVMGGDYTGTATPEWNILQSIGAAQYVMSAWPVKMVASGFEVGNDVLYPHQRLESDFPANHPLRVGYEHFLDMPYDRPCWDLTSVLYAIEPDNEWFDLSQPGKVSVDSSGVTVFTPQPDGRFRYLKLNGTDLSTVLADRVKGRCE